MATLGWWPQLLFGLGDGRWCLLPWLSGVSGGFKVHGYGPTIPMCGAGGWRKSGFGEGLLVCPGEQS